MFTTETRRHRGRQEGRARRLAGLNAISRGSVTEVAENTESGFAAGMLVRGRDKGSDTDLRCPSGRRTSLISPTHGCKDREDEARSPHSALLSLSLCLCDSPVTSYQVLFFQSGLFGKGSLINSRKPASSILRGNAPSVLSLASVAELRAVAAPDLRNPLSLVFSVSLWRCGEQEVTAFKQGRRQPALGLCGE